MSRWNKNRVQTFALPLDALVKEKENTNRPVAARSAGTVGKWGITSFTSIRGPTYGFAASFNSPKQQVSPNSNISPHSSDGAVVPSTSADLPKPRKFFKSRNIAPELPKIFEQQQQLQLHQQQTGAAGQQQQNSSPPKIRLKINKKLLKVDDPSSSSTKSPKKEKVISEKKALKLKKKSKSKDEATKIKVKPPAKPIEKPTRILSRTRKPVNYLEDRSRSPSPYIPSEEGNENVEELTENVTTVSAVEDAVPAEQINESVVTAKLVSEEPAPEPQPVEPVVDEPVVDLQPVAIEPEIAVKVPVEPVKSDHENEEISPPVVVTKKRAAANKSKNKQQQQQHHHEQSPKMTKKSSAKDSMKSLKKNAQKLTNKEPTPKPVITSPKVQHDHPPIVLRISKGTSRLISTDSEEVVTSPPYLSPKPHIIPGPGALTSTAELLAVLSDETPSSLSQILPTNTQLTPSPIKEVTLPKEPSPPPAQITVEQPKIEIKHHKPAGIKIKIKTNLAKAFITSEPLSPPLPPPPKPAAQTPTQKLSSPISKSNKKGSSKSNGDSFSKSAKVSSSPVVSPAKRPTRRSTRQNNQITECKAADAALTTTMKTNSPQPGSEHYELYRTLAASPSDKDFDSQSSILGSGVSSNFVPEIPEDSQVIHSRGSSDVTSDQDTSQNSSLVAPPSEIDLRLAAMMDGDTEPMPTDQSSANEINDVAMVSSEKPLSPALVHHPRTPSPDNVVIPESISPPVIEGRVTRNKNGLTQKKSETATTVRPLVTRSYGRKRKHPIETSPIVTTPEPIPSITANQQTNIDNTLLTTANTKSLINEINLILPPLIEQNLTKSTLDNIDDAVQDDVVVVDKPVTPKYKYNKRARRTCNLSPDEKKQQAIEKMAIGDDGFKNQSKDDNRAQNTKTNDVISSNKNENNNMDNCGEDTTLIDGEKPSVKLVISKKKGSIFKSRAIDSEAGTNKQKPKHVYKHKWDDDNNAKEKQIVPQNDTDKSTANKSYYTDFDDEDAEPSTAGGLSRVTRQRRTTPEDDEDDEDDDDDNLPITSIRCKTKAKKFYTVVRNVKKAHQIQEIGEFQEMDDDIEYILDALQPHNKMSTRCLSAIQLASKCMAPAFRMHVRAHGTVTKFFKALSDAAKDQSLGLCTATVMFVLNQDNLNMDLDRNSLELMLNLLESDVSHKNALDNCGLTREQLQRNRQKVKELCSDIKGQGKAIHLNVDNITSGTLAMETLLSLTSKRAGEWFKEELRKLGGLEHIINTVCECCRQISDYVVDWTDSLLEKLRKIERCLRVLENVSNDNEENQSYILAYKNEHAIETLIKFYKLCDSEITLYPTTDTTPKDNPGVVLREALVPTIKVLINLTHPFNRIAHGSQILGQRPIIFDTSLHLLLQASNYVPERCIFDLSLLVLLLLINLTTYTIPNRTIIMNASAPSDFGNQFDKVSAVKALIEYFYKCEELARLAEKKTDDILDNPNKKDGKKSQEEVDETVTKLLQKAGHHMEHSMLASYVSLLIGHLIMDNDLHEIQIRKFLRKGCFDEMVQILEKYYNFMNLTTSSSSLMTEHIKQTKMIIEYLKNSDSHSKSSNSSSSM